MPFKNHTDGDFYLHAVFMVIGILVTTVLLLLAWRTAGVPAHPFPITAERSVPTAAQVRTADSMTHVSSAQMRTQTPGNVLVIDSPQPHKKQE